MLLKRTFKLFPTVVLKKTDCRQMQWFYCCCCLGTAEEAEAGLVAADVLTVRRWWLEDRRLVLACWLVKTAVVCQLLG